MQAASASFWVRTQEQQRELQDAQVQALSHRVQLTGQLVKGEELLKQLHKEELNLMIRKNREYQRFLLTAGPGELLRKLAVNQITRGRELNAGQFFAFTTEGARTS